jgi:very-short-patch-repair endonuclease
VSEHDGVPIVTGAALVRDLAAVRDRAGLRTALIDLAHAGHVDLASLPGELAAVSRFPGAPVARAALADLNAAGRTDSPLELKVRRGLGRDGITLDRGQVPVPGTRINLDLGIAVIRFGIEVDSLSHHGARTSLERDATRANVVAATGEGWQVLRATWWTLGDGWAAFVSQVRRVIEVQSQLHLGLPWPPPDVLR